MKFRTLGAATGAALLALSIVPGSAHAQEKTVSELYGGAAEASTLELSVLGNRVLAGAGLASGDIDAVKGAVDGAASGIGHTLDDATMVGAGAAGEGGESCVRPDLPDLGDLTVDVSAVCGRASVSGTGTNLVATGSAALADLSVSADILTQVFENETIRPILDEAFGLLDELDEAVDTVEEQEQVQAAVDMLNATLSDLTGGLVTIPDLDVSDTVRSLVDRLQTTRLVEVQAGDALGSVVSDATSMTSTGSIAGARVKLLPGLWPDGRALATITVSESVAEVRYDRAAATTSGEANNAIVRVESPVLPEPIEVGVDQSVSLFCDDAVADLTGIETPLGDGTLCTEIAVGHAVEEQVDGRLQMSTALVDITVAKNAARLLDLTGLDIPEVEVPGLGVVGPDLVVGTVNDVLGKLGIGGVGAEDTGDGALLHLGIAGATAQGGGARVSGEDAPPAPAPDPGANPGTGDLPRTGGLGALPTLATALLGGAGGLRMVLRRRSA
jgi:hypothetical protein